MKRLGILLAILAVLVVGLSSSGAAEKAAANGKIRVLLTYGGHDFEEKPFFAMFDALPGVEYTKAPMPQSAELLKPGLEKDFDVLVMYDMLSGVTPSQQKAFVELLKDRGMGVVALHHNLGAHLGWEEFTKIIGGKFLSKETTYDGKKYGPSGWEHGQDMKVTVADRQHPITRGIKDFAIHDEVYNHYYVAPEMKVLLTTDHPKNDPKIAWVHQYGTSPVFYLMLGHDSQAWRNPVYPQILLNGIRWAAGK